MTESAARARRNDWVRIHWVILAAGERAPSVPDDTKAVPLEARANGWLDIEEAAVGDEVAIHTAAGRTLTGTLVEVNPAFGHGFGEPIEQLLAIGPDLRRRVRRAGPTLPGAPAGGDAS